MTTTSVFVITSTEHENCAECATCAESAIAEAAVTGSISLTHLDDRGGLPGGQLHSATVRRVIEPGRREAALRAYYEAIDATNRANLDVDEQRATVADLEEQLSSARVKLAELQARAAQAARDEDWANTYAQEVRS